jgi:hypothetical protein
MPQEPYTQCDQTAPGKQQSHRRVGTEPGHRPGQGRTPRSHDEVREWTLAGERRQALSLALIGFASR